ncbi:MAG: hypothetical protein JXA42_23115 [Anaerolineales bacterium]|nr:hypothetical protein [Anaerolineales bacterium]
MQCSHGNQYVQRMVNQNGKAGSVQREMFFENVAIIGDLNVTGKITEDFMPGQDVETGHTAAGKQ